MSGERVERRLAAIMAGDIAGYSRLMGRDEEGTLRDLKELRASFLHPKIAEHRGRIVKNHGRRRADRVPERRGRGALRGRDPAWDGRARRRRSG